MKALPVCFIALAAVCGCGGNGIGGQQAASHSYLGTQGPGDVWSWQISDATFTAVDETQGLHYSGTKSTLSTGFTKLTVTTTDDPNVTPPQGAYAVELPGTALIIKPAGADTKPPIFAGCVGSNPAGPQVAFNFVAVGGSSFQATDQAYGHVTFAVTGNAYAGTAHRCEIDGTTLSDAPAALTGNGGLMTGTINGSAVTGAMAPSGVCVFDFGPSAGGLIGVLQPTSNVDLADLATRSFRGFLINAGKTQCVSVTPNGDGTLHGTGYSNPTGVETGTSDSGSGVTITFLSQPNPGEVPVTIMTSGGVEQLVCAINRVAGKYVLLCFGVGQTGQPYNVLLAED